MSISLILYSSEQYRTVKPPIMKIMNDHARVQSIGSFDAKTHAVAYVRMGEPSVVNENEVCT